MRKVGIVAGVLGLLTLSLNAVAVPPAPVPVSSVAPPPASLALDRISRLESTIAAHAAKIGALEKGAAADAARISALETKLTEAAENEKQKWLLQQAKQHQQQEACMYTCTLACAGPGAPPAIVAKCGAVCAQKCGG